MSLWNRKSELLLPTYDLQTMWQGWPSTFAPGPEIRAYLTRTSDSNTSSCAAASTRKNEETEDVVNMLFMGVGSLTGWKWSDVKGLETFKGKMGEKWEDGVRDWKDKRVAVIGTGSSIQVVPTLQSYVKKLHNFVLGKTWIMPAFAAGQKTGDDLTLEKGYVSPGPVRCHVLNRVKPHPVACQTPGNVRKVAQERRRARQLKRHLIDPNHPVRVRAKVDASEGIDGERARPDEVMQNLSLKEREAAGWSTTLARIPSPALLFSFHHHLLSNNQPHPPPCTGVGRLIASPTTLKMAAEHNLLNTMGIIGEVRKGLTVATATFFRQAVAAHGTKKDWLGSLDVKHGLTGTGTPRKFTLGINGTTWINLVKIQPGSSQKHHAVVAVFAVNPVLVFDGPQAHISEANAEDCCSARRCQLREDVQELAFRFHTNMLQQPFRDSRRSSRVVDSLLKATVNFSTNKFTEYFTHSSPHPEPQPGLDEKFRARFWPGFVVRKLIAEALRKIDVEPTPFMLYVPGNFGDDVRNVKDIRPVGIAEPLLYGYCHPLPHC
ncbi:hypothetical protein BXZ70DRAFT_1053832 [Cristinia sonorae]|uniref:Uncharacterized protein n=1 Tax=Cristinia sonorae TaxID=1940300 RepID=A0A8K0UD72_9AGAR|nr:hypothetical protein BXZ70DRAFT_1053832 [Cristinia sonorae]